MKSRKTGAAMDFLKHASKYGKAKYLIFKPTIDQRNGNDFIFTYDKNQKMKATVIKYPVEILDILSDNKTVDTILISEGQFFDRTIVPVVHALKIKGYTVIVEGLVADHQGDSFGHLSQIRIFADAVYQLNAYCECKHHSHSKVGGICCSPNGAFSALTPEYGTNKRIQLGRNRFIVMCEVCFFEHYSERYVESKNLPILEQLNNAKIVQDKRTSKKQPGNEISNAVLYDPYSVIAQEAMGKLALSR